MSAPPSPKFVAPAVFTVSARFARAAASVSSVELNAMFPPPVLAKTASNSSPTASLKVWLPVVRTVGVALLAPVALKRTCPPTSVVTLSSAFVLPTSPSNCVVPAVLIVSARGTGVSESTVLANRIVPAPVSESTAFALSTTGLLYVCPPFVVTIPPLMSIITTAVALSAPERISGTEIFSTPPEVSVSVPVVSIEFSAAIGRKGASPAPSAVMGPTVTSFLS